MTTYTTSHLDVRFLVAYADKRRTTKESVRFLTSWADTGLQLRFTSVFATAMGFAAQPSLSARPLLAWSAGPMTVLKEVFPYNISFNSISALTFEDDVVSVDSGVSQRVSRWDQPLLEFDVGYGVRTLEQLHALIRFYRVSRGRQYGFLFYDPLDFRTTTAVNIEARNPPPPGFTDQQFGIGNGTQTLFQLTKTYQPVDSGSPPAVRPIYKPITGGTFIDSGRNPQTAYPVRVGINGVEQLSGWSVDYTTGLLTFSSAPANGALLTWGGEFYVPVAFNTKRLPVTLEEYGIGGATDVKLIELRFPDAVAP